VISLRIRFWGVRGTIPVPGQETVKYGGNTPCLDILTSDQQVIIIDAGTGIRNLGRVLQEEHPRHVIGNIFLSHTHWDHIQGLPFFEPLSYRRNRFIVYGSKRVGRHLEEILAGQFFEPYLPFAYRSLRANLNVEEVNSGDTIFIGENTAVTMADLDHPGGCLGFRIEDNGVVLTYCSDTRHEGVDFSETVLSLVHGSDLLIHDSHFASRKLSTTFTDWGHSSWYEAACLAREANVETLGLFHYSPDLVDEELDQIHKEVRSHFSQTIMTREGLVLQLPLEQELPD
jgi:ribonuclease Z